MILRDTTVMVSGVGTGLGREVARLALRDCARLVLAARTESVHETTAKQLYPSGVRVAYARTDITSAGECEALVAHAMQRFGAVDAVFQVAVHVGALSKTRGSLATRRGCTTSPRGI